MPAFSFHCLRLQFPCLPRLRSQPCLEEPSLRHDTAVSVGVSSASSPRCSGQVSSPEQDIQAAIGTSCLPLSNCARRRTPVERALDGSSGQRSWPFSRVNPVASVPQHSPYRRAVFSRRSLNSRIVTGQRPGLFNQARNFVATGTFIENNVTHNYPTSNQFMEKLLEMTIPGAAFDSSARYPPPRCHAGTRLAILGRCLQFIATCRGEKKVRWVVGAAGVGKSAIMQSVVESPKLAVSCHASVFFSVNGRNDGTKAIITISYQLAAKSKRYRQAIEYEIARDPSLLQSSLPVQFQKLIIEPFIHQRHLKAVGRILIIIDGLDECSDPLIQQELLRLISDFCIKYPSSRLVWLIASRPEAHITSFFSRTEVMPAYEKEEILVDSNEARADVERFLRAALARIKMASGLPDPQWPKELDFSKIAGASGGLFAYAWTVVRYIGDSRIGSPALQLSDVLNVIDKHSTAELSREDHPMALLDALYARILSNVPSKVMIHTRKLGLALVSDWDLALRSAPAIRGNFIVLCNWLGMTPDEAYAAINQLRSVFRVPRHAEAHKQNLVHFHKSFIDYISDFSRSGFFPDINHAVRQLKIQCAFRILNEAPDGVDFGDVNYGTWYGTLRRGPGTGNGISLTWLADERVGWDDNKTRLGMYKLAIGVVTDGIGRRVATFLNVSCIRLLTTRFETYVPDYFPYHEMRDLVFDASLRNEFMTHGLLKHMPLKTVNVSNISTEVKLRFRRPATTVTNLSDPWDSSCTHEREGEWGEGKDMDWITDVSRFTCKSCYRRSRRQLKSWETRFPDHTITLLFTSTRDCFFEVRCVDPEDGISEWTYWSWFGLSLEECKKYGISR